MSKEFLKATHRNQVVQAPGSQQKVWTVVPKKNHQKFHVNLKTMLPSADTEAPKDKRGGGQKGVGFGT